MNNKLVSKMLLREHGIHTPDGIELRPDDDLADRLRPFIGKTGRRQARIDQLRDRHIRIRASGD